MYFNRGFFLIEISSQLAVALNISPSDRWVPDLQHVWLEQVLFSDHSAMETSMHDTVSLINSIKCTNAQGHFAM